MKEHDVTVYDSESYIQESQERPLWGKLRDWSNMIHILLKIIYHMLLQNGEKVFLNS